MSVFVCFLGDSSPLICIFDPSNKMTSEMSLFRTPIISTLEFPIRKFHSKFEIPKSHQCSLKKNVTIFHFWMSLSFPGLSHPMNPIGMPIWRLRWHQILPARRPAGHFAEKMEFFTQLPTMEVIMCLVPQGQPFINGCLVKQPLSM